ncbi:hypothetical protein D6C81_06927 [Aureobasidium pullulans]|nr:hypothetical protein D6C81_06927 [Aureobasidium pullulans]
MMFKQSVLAVSAFFMAANAHLFISSPNPIPGTAIKNPLADDGSNFPCHGVALPGSGGQKMAVGSEQKLTFDAGAGLNTAVHGGGSCQLSLTYETDPQKVKQADAWKVIYSIEGGCPTNTLANLDGNYTGPDGPYTVALACDDPRSNNFDCINTFDFTIPQGVKNGQATLAWTWFNNVGNREIYMNCVAVDITGGSDDATMSEFPDIFLANMGPAYGDVKTDEYPVQNVKFPNPGKYVTTKTAITTYMSNGVVQTVSTASSFPLAIPSRLGTLGGAGSGPTSYAAAPTSYAAASSSYVPGSSYAAVPTSYALAPSSYAAIPTLATSVSVVPLPSGTGYAGSYKNSNSTSGSCSGGKVSCPSPGELVCIDNKSFGICDIDYCAVPRPVSLGTTCSNGIVDKRDVVRRRSSRIHRHIPGHIHHKFSF